MRILVATLLLALTFACNAPANDLTLLVPMDGTVVAAYDPAGVPVEVVCGQAGNPTCGQQFTVGRGGAYVDTLELGFDYSATSYGTCYFTMLITDNVVYNYSTGALSFGTIFLKRDESKNLDSTYQNFQKFTFTDTFPAVWLPAGNYYFVMRPRSCPNGTDLIWTLDGQNSTITTVGTVGNAFSWNNSEDPSIPFVGAYTLNVYPALPIFSFALEGPVLLAPTGGGMSQTARLVVGAATPAPGGPLRAQIGFVNAATGDLLAPLTPVTLNPGQIESVDLDLTPFVSRLGQRIEVQPIIVQSPNAPGAVSPGPIQISATVQILDAMTGFGTVLAPVPPPGASAPALGPQILAGGQTMRAEVVAIGPDPCVGQVAFSSSLGNSFIPAVQVNLAPGTGTSVDLSADALALRLGQRIEVQPVLTVGAPAAAVALNSVCSASVEVFDHVTGHTWTHQSTFAGIPAVQAPATGAVGAGPSSAALETGE